MRICILGGDGYLGWPTAMHFSARGHEVMVVDNMAKRGWEEEVGAAPLEPVPTLRERVRHWCRKEFHHMDMVVGNIADNGQLMQDICSDFRPEAIIHYGEQPSAPYSMLNHENAVYTQCNNVVGTLNVMFAMREHCPQAHLVKLGTMGEYGTPNIDIEEGWLEVTHNGRKDRVLYPKKPHSLYHLSKVHDSHNLEFASRMWDFRVTDLNQGVVYGIDTDEIGNDPELCTSFHYDDIFGTVLNRFVVQAAIGMPLTVYGSGRQIRGYLNIRDTLRCIELAVENPAGRGEFRVFNQFTEQFSIMELAEQVRKSAAEQGLKVEIQHLRNPRVEQEDHYYHAKHTGLPGLGLEPHLLSNGVIGHMLTKAMDGAAKVNEASILPKVDWKHGWQQPVVDEPAGVVCLQPARA